MKGGRRGSAWPRALLVGLGLPALGLFALFSLIPYERMTGDWPVDISPEEVHFYQRWFDQRPDSMAVVEVQRFDLDSSGTCMEAEGDAASFRRFSAIGHVDSAEVRHLRDSWVLTFPADRPFHDQHALVLRPATMNSIQACYAQLLAMDLGLVAARTEFVRLWSCGDDQGLFLSEEMVTPEFVSERGAPGSVLLERTALAKADSGIAADAGRAMGTIRENGEIGRSGAAAVAAWGLLNYAADAPLTGRSATWFEPETRSVVPVWGGSGPDRATSDTLLVMRLSLRDEQDTMRAMATRLGQDSAKWEARLAEVDAANASAFVSDTRIGYVRAQLAQERKRFLTRLFHPDLEARYGEPQAQPPIAAEPVIPLDPFLRKYVVGDTIRFPRGKYTIDHSITVPKGMGVVLEKGARLNMGPGTGLIVNGPLHMRGTALNPVFVRPVDEAAAWAGIRVNGTGSTPCVISGLKMSGGAQADATDADHGAMLSFHDCHVTITNSSITEAKGPAALGVVRGNLKLNACAFSGGSHAQVDVRFAGVELTTCSFVGRGTPNGVVAYGTEIQVKGGAFEKFTGSAVTATLKSRVLVRECTFSQNHEAVVAENGTAAHVDGGHFVENEIALEARRGKSPNTGGHISYARCTFERNSLDQRADEVSRVDANVGPGREALSSFDLEGR